MSYYYSYYIGYKKDGKFFPLGPYDSFGELHPVLCKSRSFASDLHTEFLPIKGEEVSDELRKDFEFTDWQGNKIVDVKYLTVKDLPTGSFIKKGYFLIDDVKAYEEDKYAFDIFYDHLSPSVYAAKLENELKFGKPKPKKDEFGEEYEEHSVSDYIYYAYPDYDSIEFEAWTIRNFIEEFVTYKVSGEYEVVVLETEG